MTGQANTFEQVCSYARETAMYESILWAIEYDERTVMPPAGGPYRAEQVTLMSGLVHQRRTDPQYGDWLNKLVDRQSERDPHSKAAATIRQLKREYDKQVRLPQSLVRELTRCTVLGQQAWVEARKNNDFRSFVPFLEKIVTLKQEQADALGHSGTRYDALLDEYEPEETTKHVREILDGLRSELVPLIEGVRESSHRGPIHILKRSYPIGVQETFGKQVATQLGFSFERGVLGVTHHPFCTTLGPHDCRITTRYDEHWFPGAFFGVLHEAGHGMYEQGLLADQFGLPPGKAVSLGVHESQSRMWENFVGRSNGFWQHFFRPACSAFPTALHDVSLDQFYFAVNDVRPSLIRVEADEATYNLHIIIRFQLEESLIGGSLAVRELPEAWNASYQKYLGITPDSDSNGVLQDIHWSAGLIGYFPTYSLGNLYAAQLFEQADRDLGGLNSLFARGEFSPLLDWLRLRVHQRGQCCSAAELVQEVTGKSLGADALVRHLRSKLRPLYEI